MLRISKHRTDRSQTNFSLYKINLVGSQLLFLYDLIQITKQTYWLSKLPVILAAFPDALKRIDRALPKLN